mgnify:CR=1 FL=1
MKDDNERFEARVQGLAANILADYEGDRVIDRLEMFTQPDRQIIEELISKLLRLVFPGYFRDYTYRIYNPKNNLSALIEDVAFHLNRQIGIALRGNGRCPEDHINRTAESLTAAFLAQLKQASAVSFSDVEGHWARPYIEFTTQQGLFSGIGDGKFGPDLTVNRAMLVTVLSRLYGGELSGGSVVFDDVAAGSWYYDAVSWGAENGIVMGYGNGQFRPESPVTREQMAAFLQRYTSLTEGRDVSASAEVLNRFPDAGAVMSSSSFSPESSVTRPEILPSALAARLKINPSCPMARRSP